MGATEQQSARRTYHPGLANPSTGAGGQHLDAQGAADLAKGLAQQLRRQRLLPILHRTEIVQVGHADQIGQLLVPDFTAVFGTCATAAAVKNRFQQATLKKQHLASGGGHRFSGGGCFRLHAPVHLAGGGGRDIEQGPRLALAQHIGARRHRLGPQGGLGPAGRHLTAHHTGQILLQGQMVDHPQAGVNGQDLQLTAVAALPDLQIATNCAPGASPATNCAPGASRPLAITRPPASSSSSAITSGWSPRQRGDSSLWGRRASQFPPGRAQAPSGGFHCQPITGRCRQGAAPIGRLDHQLTAIEPKAS